MKILAWIVCLGLLAYAASTAFWEYSRVSSAVGRALEAAPAGGADRASFVQESVVQAARGMGVPLGEGAVTVVEDDRGISVRLTWSHPMLVLQGRTAVAVPLWLARSAPTSAAN